MRALWPYLATPGWGRLRWGIVCGLPLAGVSPPFLIVFFVCVRSRPSWMQGGGLWVWFSALLCCGSVVVAVACSGLGPLGPCSLSPLHFGFFSLSAVAVFLWPAACHFPGGLVCWRVRSVFSSGPSAAAWSCWAASSPWASSGWTGWLPSILSAGPVGVAFGVAWLEGCLPRWSGCAASRLSDCPPCCPSFPLAGGCALVGVWVWSANSVANWVAVGVVVGRGLCPGSLPFVVYVHPWAGGPSCWVRLWFCRLGGCDSRFPGVIG